MPAWRASAYAIDGEKADGISRPNCHKGIAAKHLGVLSGTDHARERIAGVKDSQCFHTSPS
jgi:hypothetical protein